MITTMSALAAVAGLLLFVFAMLSAAVSDLTTYKIRNNLILTLLIAYLAFAPIAGFTCQEILRSVVVAGGVLLVSFALFAAGWIGGGDAKLASVTTYLFAAYEDEFWQAGNGARRLFGGEQQRLALARALAPTASIDPATTKAVEAIIRAIPIRRQDRDGDA